MSEQFIDMYDAAKDWSSYAPQASTAPVKYSQQRFLAVFFLAITLFLLSVTVSNNKSNLSIVNILQFFTVGALASLTFGIGAVFLSDCLGVYV